MKSTEVGLWLGLLIGVVGGSGMFFGGYLADRVGRRDTRWSLWLVSVMTLVALPFGCTAWFVDDVHVALALFVLPVVASNFWQATTFAQAQGMVRLRMRAMTSALVLFIANIIGLGAGPWAIGAVSDLLAPSLGTESLRWSLFLFGFIGPWAAWHFYLAGRHLPRDLARVDED